MILQLTTFLAFSSLGLSQAANLRANVKDDVGVLGLGQMIGGRFGSDQTTVNQNHGRRLAQMRGLADFDWEIQPEPGFPTIDFEGGSEDNEVRFLYNYTGTTDDDKFFTWGLFQGDCITDASDTAVSIVGTPLPDNDIQELQIDVDILQETVSGTPEYTDIDVSTAQINFCIRVDYNHRDSRGDIESINFHETNVTITIDLTAGFELTAINVDRIDADQVDADAELNCDVQAYFCDANNNEKIDPRFVQGEIMTVCVEIADDDRDLYHISDVLTMSVEQTKNNEVDKDISDIVIEQFAVGLSDKYCRNGVCNVKHQLSSKFFDERNPGDLEIAGVAICAFGPLDHFYKRVNRDFSDQFKQDNEQALESGVRESVQACETECTNSNLCQTFSAVPDDDGQFICDWYNTFPLDEDLVVSDTVDVWARNDNIAPIVWNELPQQYFPSRVVPESIRSAVVDNASSFEACKDACLSLTDFDCVAFSSATNINGGVQCVLLETAPTDAQLTFDASVNTYILEA